MSQTPVSRARAGIEASRLALKVAPGLLVAYALVMFAQSVASVLVVWLTKLVIDGLVDAPGWSPLPAAGVLITVGVVRPAVVEGGQFLSAQLDRRVGRHSHDRLYAAVTGLNGLSRFESPQFQDQLRLAQQAAGPMSSRVLTDLLGLATTVLTMFGLLGSLWLINPVMAGMVLACLVPTLWSELALARRRTAMMLGLSPIERREYFYSTLLSSPEAAQEVRIFGIGQFLRRRMMREREHSDRLRLAQDGRELLFQGVLGILAASVAGAGLIWGVLAVGADEITVGDLSLYLAAVAGIQSGLSTVASSLARVSHLLAMFGQYCAIIDAEPDLPTVQLPMVASDMRAGLELRDVWFRYGEGQPWILRGVSIFIPQGMSAALVGRNGAGKSTLVKLLCRFYDPDRGAIYWDGVDIRLFDPASLRQRISALFQDFMRYDLSARENIALGDIGRLGEQEAVIAAARTAGIHDVIADLPRGYSTYLTRIFKDPLDDSETSGVLLSGGQWQRVALARALMRRQRDLLILDEPSSGLDAVAEREIQATIRAHRLGCTSILISHRMASLRDADLIIVLANGVVLERGNHSELIALGGEYAELFSAQANGYSMK